MLGVSPRTVAAHDEHKVHQFYLHQSIERVRRMEPRNARSRDGPALASPATPLRFLGLSR